jgi:uncharacterized protein YsxB (DUF464 family)
MSSELNFELLKTNCFTNLKILSKLKVGDKLLYQNDLFYIDSWTYTQPLYRWYYNETRHTTLKHLNDFIQSVFNFIEIIYSNEMGTIENNYYIQVSKPQIFNEENSTLLINIINELQNTINGLNNIKQTYKQDIHFVSSIDILIEKIQVRIKKIHNSLSIKNKI